MDLGLNGKKALITGSSSGLGLATALALAAEGAQVAINGRDAARLEQATAQVQRVSATPVVHLSGDLSDPQVPAGLVANAVTAMGGLDILITNTGGPRTGPFVDLSDADWARAVDLCLMAHVRLIRAALPALQQSHAAAVLTITSISVKQPIDQLILSNSVRAATIGLTKSLALELGSQGIRVNSILPASTATDRIQHLMQNRAQQNGTSLEEELRKQALESPLGRIAAPEEFARVAAFLVSPAASYLTGVMLPVDGGSYKGTF
jgi:3-oxoacyl-[acyl-carrier protein] reductase